MLTMSDLPVPTEVLDNIIDRAFAEDVGSGDVTTTATVPAGATAHAQFAAKATGTLAGVSVARYLLERVDKTLNVRFHQADGSRVKAGTIFGTVEGPAAPLLVAERSMLNIMQRMSGIATATRRMVDAAQPHKAQILDTRKTAPGLRALDKWAVRLGGGTNHRHGLYDMVLIKENHIATAGGIKSALRSTHQYLEVHDLELPIEVETQNLEEIKAVLDSGRIDRILLDNMVKLRPDGSVDTSKVEEALELIDGQVPAEVSGNVTLETVPAIAATGVEYISSGALTHSVRALDISLLIEINR